MPATDSLIDSLKSILGSSNVLTSVSRTKRFTTGYRFGAGPVLAVIQPATLVEMWHALRACVDAGVIVIMQAANTGLTGGSTPAGEYDRPVILISTTRIRNLHLIADGRQAVCLPGTTLHDLETALRPLGREPHSVIGSSCVGASVIGGICNNSGGSLVRRGPAYTEFSLYARVDDAGELQLVNHLGINLGSDPEAILHRLQKGEFAETDVEWPNDRRASDENYESHIRDIDSKTPARFNADPSRLFEASGSAGKVALFGVRVDTFPINERTAVFYIGTNKPEELTALRRDILARFKCLPIIGEYLHRDAFDIAARYGKDTFIAIRRLGTSRLPTLFALKARIDALAARLPFLPDEISDHLLQALNRILPAHLPRRMIEFRRRFEHHLILKMSDEGIDEARAYLAENFAQQDSSAYFECTHDEAEKALLHRFTAAGAAVRFRAVHRDEVPDIVALDIALRRNERDWFETLPAEIEKHILHKLYYGHFFCHVFHQDYILRKGASPHDVEAEMLKLLDRREAEYPAEHNVGHCYPAKPALANHYRELDPRNMFNPGIGRSSRNIDWNEAMSSATCCISSVDDAPIDQV